MFLLSHPFSLPIRRIAFMEQLVAERTVRDSNFKQESRGERQKGICAQKSKSSREVRPQEIKIQKDNTSYCRFP